VSDLQRKSIADYQPQTDDELEAIEKLAEITRAASTDVVMGLLATITARDAECYRLESERLKGIYRVAELEKALRDMCLVALETEDATNELWDRVTALIGPVFDESWLAGSGGGAKPEGVGRE